MTPEELRKSPEGQELVPDNWGIDGEPKDETNQDKGEKVTPEDGENDPDEKPITPKPGDTPDENAGDDDGEQEDDESKGKPDPSKALQGLKTEEDKLDQQIADLRNRISEKRGVKRDLVKEAEAEGVEIRKPLGGKAHEISAEQPENPTKTPPDAEEDTLDDLDPTFLAVFDRVAKAKGLVHKDELLREQANDEAKQEQATYMATRDSIIDAFMNEHPEYKQENDSDDTRWNALNGVLEKFPRPKDPTIYEDLLEMSHNRVKASFAPDNPPKPSKDVADKTKLKKASQGGTGTVTGASSGGSTTGAYDKKVYQDQIALGFTPEQAKGIAIRLHKRRS